MKRIHINFLLLLILCLFPLSGCENYRYSDESITYIDPDPVRKADYEKFKSLDFSQDIIYLYQNFHLRFDTNINWFSDVFNQNLKVSEAIQEKYFDRIIKFDDSKIEYENGKISYFEIIYYDGYNPKITKQLPIMYIDVTKNNDGTSTNIITRPFSMYQMYDDYEIEFTSFDDDYYSFWFYNSKFQRSFYTKYNGPQTYYIEGIPAVKIWKDKIGYRIDALNSGELSQSTENKTKHFVYPRDITTSSGAWFLNQKPDTFLEAGIISDNEYEVKYNSYDEGSDSFTLHLTIYDEDKTINVNKIFTISDYLSQRYTEEYLDYIVDIKRVTNELVNITFASKGENNIYSYSITASN